MISVWALKTETRYGKLPLRAGEGERDRVRVGGDRATRREHALEAGVAGRDQALHRGDDVGGGERRAVLPVDALAQVERPDRAVGVRAST